MRVYALTTKDNPYDVFNDFINWMRYDHQRGYYTSELLARIARTSEELSEEENQREIERAIDTIIQMHPVQKVTENSKKENKDNNGADDSNTGLIEYVKVSKNV